MYVATLIDSLIDYKENNTVIMQSVLEMFEKVRLHPRKRIPESVSILIHRVGSILPRFSSVYHKERYLRLTM